MSIAAQSPTRPGKTGGQNGPWVTLERPKPPPVANIYTHWVDAPSTLSQRCEYWLRQVRRGWRPSGRVRRMGREEAAEWYGVYIWEYVHVIVPSQRVGDVVAEVVP